jgi:hypothetical protein
MPAAAGSHCILRAKDLRRLALARAPLQVHTSLGSSYLFVLGTAVINTHRGPSTRQYGEDTHPCPSPPQQPLTPGGLVRMKQKIWPGPARRGGSLFIIVIFRRGCGIVLCINLCAFVMRGVAKQDQSSMILLACLLSIATKLRNGVMHLAPLLHASTSQRIPRFCPSTILG